MAKSISTGHYKKPKIKRPGVHAKTKTSKCKSSRNYKKTYKAQGR
jgi:hypothetical protein